MALPILSGRPPYSEGRGMALPLGYCLHVLHGITRATDGRKLEVYGGSYRIIILSPKMKLTPWYILRLSCGSVLTLENAHCPSLLHTLMSESRLCSSSPRRSSPSSSLLSPRSSTTTRPRPADRSPSSRQTHTSSLHPSRPEHRRIPQHIRNDEESYV